MSARCSGNVWKHSQHKGSDLLVLLAIADYAKDDGTGAWPSVAGLAEKTRLSERNIQYILRKLEASGELVIEKHAGPRGCHLYHVVVDTEGAKIAPVGGAKIAGAKFAGGATQRQEGVQTSAEGGAIAIAPEPLIEPLVKPSLSLVVPGQQKASKRGDVPEVFPLTPEMIAWAKSIGFRGGLERLHDVTDNFLDHHASNGNEAKIIDWPRAWKKWVRRAIRYGEDLDNTNGGYTDESGRPLNKRSQDLLRTLDRLPGPARPPEPPRNAIRLVTGEDSF